MHCNVSICYINLNKYERIFRPIFNPDFESVYLCAFFMEIQLSFWNITANILGNNRVTRPSYRMK